MQVRAVTETRDILGEGPVWCMETRTLYWVDIRGPAVHSLRPSDGARRRWPMPDLVGSLALRRRGGLLVALPQGLSLFDAESGTLTLAAAPEARGEHMRFNDGKCDRRGRFWVGTMNDLTHAPVGSLYCLDLDGSLTARLDGIGIPNSLCWSPDGSVMYFADTAARTIWAFDYDQSAGRFRNRRVFAVTMDGPGAPDGSTVDQEGFLWNAEYGGWRLVRYAPDGRIDRVVALPVSSPTSCAFGGPDLRTLYVTSASENLSPEELARHPLAGAVLAVEVGVAGVPEPRFAG